MAVLRQLRDYFWKDRRFLYLSIITLAFATALGLIYPNLLRFLIDEVIGKSRYEVVPILAALVVVTFVVKATMTFFQGYFGAKLGNKFVYNLRNALYEKLQYLSFQYYDKARTGDLMSRLTADLEATRQFIGFGFAQILNVIFMVCFGSIMMLVINWQLTLVALVTMPFLVFTAVRFEGRIHPAFRQIRQSFSQLTTAVQENITGVRTVKAFAREPHEVEKFSLRSEGYKVSNIETSQIWAKYFPLMELMANLSVVILLGSGGYMVIQGMLTLGDLVAFFSLIWYIIGPMWGIGYQINNYTQSKAAGERILEILHHYVHVKDDANAVDLDSRQVKGHVKFEHVTFAYPQTEPSLYDFSVDARPGSVIGLLGGTGSGKSTVIQLLMRAYNVKEGRILLDEQDIQRIQVEALRNQIAAVFQETFLFSASIRNNIAYGDRDATMEEIVRAAKLAQAHDFIMEMPQGYDTVVGERGLGLSGGQKQRIAIARALLRNPRILILDDATSAVDMETEHAIQAGFSEVMRGRTTFIIAHRISSLKHADEIIVLDKGHIVQRGTHDQLLQVEGPYLDTYRIQYADQPEQAEDPGTDHCSVEEEVAASQERDHYSETQSGFRRASGQGGGRQ